KQMIELHGGSVVAHSDGPGLGSEFVVRLPLTANKSVSTTEEESAAASSGRLRLLVVDDDHDVAAGMELLLNSLGHETRIVHDGEQALAAASTFQPDAILLDLGMPGMDGFETARRLRATAAGRDALLIALTGWSREQDSQRTAAAGFDHHLAKPVEADVLEQVLAEPRTKNLS
ncbi:MAG TPA: response regulator, partial [Salinisphaeraceae bacterium]|nr:response regulator [Salinisphaeraceae bacterium]